MSNAEQLWMQVYVAAIRAGRNSNDATIMADKAHDIFLARFT